MAAMPLLIPPPALDYAGVAVFALTGALSAARGRHDIITFWFFAVVTGVGGGTLRDVVIREIPSVLSSGLYAIPALLGAGALVLATELGHYGLGTAIGAAALCFVVRMVGVHFDLNAPMPRSPDDPPPDH